MPTKATASTLLAVMFLFSGLSAHAQTPADAFRQGEALLAKGNFEAALQSYAAAATTETGNQEYMQHYAMVRRVIDLRGRLATETDPQRWEYMARGLHAFYSSEQIYPELLKVDQEIHTRLNSAESAAMLAETQLAMGRHADVVQTLSALASAKTTAATQSLLGIALAGSGKTDGAQKIALDLRLPADAGPSTNYAAARLYAATGNSVKALGLLRTCFETTPPSQLENLKSHARICPEFALQASSAEFARVLETNSKVPESKCSGGSSCAGCPMSGKCPKSQAKQ